MIHYNTFPYTFLLYIFLGITCSVVKGQGPGTCPNSDFSLGDFTNWDGYYGHFTNPAESHGFALNRHTIINAPGSYDLHSCGELLTIPPGESHSARLGNSDVYSEAEQLRYSIDVTNETNLFIYKYAVVLVNFDHLPELQPNFTIEVNDNSGNVIDPVCGYYHIYAQTGLPDWHSCTYLGENIIWKDWTTVGIDLSPYTGQTITIVFTTRDCASLMHYGYAYISAHCGSLQILYDGCLSDTTASVTAPPGFTYLWSNGATTQTTILHNPSPGKVDSCILTAANGCKVTIHASFEPTIVKAGFDAPPDCIGTAIAFNDSSTTNKSIITNWKWDFGDGSPPVTDVQDPQHSYSSIGPFNARLVAYSSVGCADTANKLIEVAPVPVLAFTPGYTCSSKITIDTIYFYEQVRLAAPAGFSHYTWNTGDSTWSILVTTEGWYKVTIENADHCYTTDSVMLAYCYVPLNVPNAFSPNNDGFNDLFRPLTLPEKVSSFIMFIYNSSGSIIYETRDVRRGWDGTNKGKPVATGIYTYHVIYENPSGEKDERTGIVTLLK